MCTYVSIIKNDKQHVSWKRGNFGRKPKFYGTSKQKKKKFGRETETHKEKGQKFQLTEEMVEYLLDLLKRYKVMCDFFGKDFDANKTVQ